MDKVKQILLSTQAKRFYWTTLAGFLGVILVGLTEIDWVYAPVLIAVIAGITKEINNKYSK